MPPTPIREFHADQLRVLVFRDRAELGLAAAAHVAEVVRLRQIEAGSARMIFAAAPSQNEFLDGLAAAASVDWARIDAFHMDEYLGLTPDHPASFRRYLKERLFDRVGLPRGRVHLIAGEDVKRPLATALTYECALRAAAPDLVCGGVGENGHLAFNDPLVADFLDPVAVKPVRLDDACRRQQVNDGCFATLDDVPTHAYTLTIPALTAARAISLCVPGPSKAEAVRATVRDPVSEACPATIVRRHPDAVMFLDVESAALVG